MTTFDYIIVGAGGGTRTARLAEAGRRVLLREAGGVLGSDLSVHGAQGLRVVGASVFPRIPGFFIVSAVYVVAERLPM